MISPFILRLLRLLPICRYVGASPLTFNAHQMRFSLDPKVVKKCKRNFQMHLAWIGLSGVILARFYRNGDFDRFNQTLPFWLLIVLVGIVYSVPAYFHHDFCKLGNGIFTFFLTLQRKTLKIQKIQYMEWPTIFCFLTLFFLRNIAGTFFLHFDPSKSKVGLTLNIFVATFIGSIICILGLCVTLGTLQPRGFIFIGQLIPEKYFYFPVGVLAICYHVYLMTCVSFSAAIAGSGALIYCFNVAMVIKELRLGRRKYTSEDTLRTLKPTMHVYRSLQVIHATAMYLFGPYLVVFNAIFMMSTIYVNFVLMRYWGSLELLTRLLLWFINFILTFYLVLLWLGCTFFVGSLSTLRSWKGLKWSETKAGNKEMKAFQRSCRPILMCWGNHFVIRRQSIFVYGRGVVRGTFRALLTTK